MVAHLSRELETGCLPGHIRPSATAEKSAGCRLVGWGRCAGCCRLGVHKSLGHWYCPVPQSGAAGQIQNVALQCWVEVGRIETDGSRVSEDEVSEGEASEGGVSGNSLDKAEVSKAEVDRTDVDRTVVDKLAVGEIGADMNQEKKGGDPERELDVDMNQENKDSRSQSKGVDRANWASVDWLCADWPWAVVVVLAAFPLMGHWS